VTDEQTDTNRWISPSRKAAAFASVGNGLSILFTNGQRHLL